MLRYIFKIVTANKSFFLPYLTFLFFCLLALFLFEKGSIHIAINSESNGAADVFFKYLTFLGDGRMITVYALILVFISYRSVLILLISNLFTGGITLLLKIYVFNDVLRPLKYFENIYQLRLVPGVDVYLHNSMPSGHTAVAFCSFTTFSLLSKNKSLGFLFFLIAGLIGFSRIYLSQHFLNDVLIGSLIGVFFALLVYSVFEKTVQSKKLEGALFKKYKA